MARDVFDGLEVAGKQREWASQAARALRGLVGPAEASRSRRERHGRGVRLFLCYTSMTQLRTHAARFCTRQELLTENEQSSRANIWAIMSPMWWTHIAWIPVSDTACLMRRRIFVVLRCNPSEYFFYGSSQTLDANLTLADSSLEIFQRHSSVVYGAIDAATFGGLGHSVNYRTS